MKWRCEKISPIALSETDKTGAKEKKSRFSLIGKTIWFSPFAWKWLSRTFSSIFFFISDVMSFHEAFHSVIFPFVSIAILLRKENFHERWLFLEQALTNNPQSSQFCSVSQFVRSKKFQVSNAEINWLGEWKEKKKKHHILCKRKKKKK